MSSWIDQVKGMVTKTVRSRFPHEVGEKVEGCVILESRVVIPPNPAEMRRGVYEYVVEVPPAPANTKTRTRQPAAARQERSQSAAPDKSSFTRATPEEMGGVIRRLPSR